jgi:hypothetical protein
MPGKNSKQSTKAVTETPVEPVVATAAPVVSAAPAQKGGKKAAAKQAPAAEAVAPAAPVVATPAVEAAPAQKGGKKAAAKQATAATPAVEAAAPAPAATPAQKGGKKAAAKTAAAAPAAAAPAQKGGKKAAAKPAAAAAPKKAAKQAAAPAAAQAGGDEEADEESGDRRVRSFKVKLPNREDFEGRFTGLTPYQAANKALSKYFRETEKPLVEITFSICESTRKSRKSVYTYVGKRQKLEKPVVYKIQDGREIVKSFKNSLKKVKKSEASTSA